VCSGTLVCSMMKTCLFEALPFFHLFFQNDHKHILRCKLYRYFCTTCGPASLVWRCFHASWHESPTPYNIMSWEHAMHAWLFPILEPDLFPHAPSILAFTTFIRSEHIYTCSLPVSLTLMDGRDDQSWSSHQINCLFRNTTIGCIGSSLISFHSIWDDKASFILSTEAL